MTSNDIKEFIILNDKIEYILEELNCHHIKLHDNRYYTFGMPDGDNNKSTILYIDNLSVIANTRDIQDEYGHSDLFSLICFLKDMYFSNALKWLCDLLNLDYYSNDTVELPMSIQITQLLQEMNKGLELEENTKVKPIAEVVLDTYYKIPNSKFLKEGISIKTQQEFELGMDLDSQRITIPIRDELGTLVGVKGRLLNSNSSLGDKYIYLEKCPKTRMCYGLYKTMKYIKETRICIVVESEKSVIKLWEYGIRNAVAIGGHEISKYQVEMLTRLGINEIVFCYDEDVSRNEDNGKIVKEYYLKEANKFIDHIKVSAMVDLEGNILDKKESPADDFNKFNKLYEERKMLKSE